MRATVCHLKREQGVEELRNNTDFLEFSVVKEMSIRDN